MGLKNSHRIEAVGFSGGIWLLWNDLVSVNIISNDWQFISFKLCFPNNKQALVTAVYGSPQPQIRRRLWRMLDEISVDVQEPCLVFGDFNAITDEGDKVGGRKSKGCRWFREWIQNSEMSDLGFTGSKFTWSRGRCHVRLDRALVNEEWGASFMKTTVTNLPPVASDHSPILVSIKEITGQAPIPKQFRYLAMWESHTKWHKWLKGSWCKERSLQEAQDILVSRIQEWKFYIFGDLVKRKNRVLARFNSKLKPFNCSKNEPCVDRKSALFMKLEIS